MSFTSCALSLLVGILALGVVLNASKAKNSLIVRTQVQIFPGGSDSKASAYNAGRPRFYPWNWEGNGNPLQYSCLGNPMDGGWQTTVHEVTKSQPWPWEFHLKITPFSSTQSQLIWSFNYSPLQHPFTPSCDITMGMTSHLLCYFLMVRTVFPLYRWGDCAGSLNTFCAEEWP